MKDWTVPFEKDKKTKPFAVPPDWMDVPLSRHFFHAEHGAKPVDVC